MTINFLPNLQNKTSYDQKKVGKTDFRRDDFAALRSRGYLTEDRITFSGSFNKFLELEKMPCPYCEKPTIMITPHEQTAFGFFASTAKGKPLQGAIRAQLGDMFDTVERRMAFRLVDLSKKHSGKTLQELLGILAPSAEKRLVREQNWILKRASTGVPRLQGETRVKAQVLLDKAKADILIKRKPVEQPKDIVSAIETMSQNLGNTEPGQGLGTLSGALSKFRKPKKQKTKKPGFKRGELLSAFDDLHKAETDESNKKEIGRMIRILNKLPKSSDSIDSFVVKYYRRSPREIAETLLRPYVATQDHAKAKSKGGASSASNSFAAHADCNGRKTDEEFPEFFAQNPYLETSIPRHLSAVKVSVEKQHRDTSHGAVKPNGKHYRASISLDTLRKYLFDISNFTFKNTDGKIKMPYMNMSPNSSNKNKSR